MSLAPLPDEILVDARGHRCPVPTLKLRRALEDHPGAPALRLLADDPLARIDVPHLAASLGLSVEVSAQESVLCFRVTRSGQA